MIMGILGRRGHKVFQSNFSLRSFYLWFFTLGRSVPAGGRTLSCHTVWERCVFTLCTGVFHSAGTVLSRDTSTEPKGNYSLIKQIWLPCIKWRIRQFWIPNITTYHKYFYMMATIDWQERFRNLYFKVRQQVEICFWKLFLCERWIFPSQRSHDRDSPVRHQN